MRKVKRPYAKPFTRKRFNPTRSVARKKRLRQRRIKTLMRIR